MISVNALQYAFLQQGDLTDSKYIKSLSVVQRDYYLNRAKDLILEIFSKKAETDSNYADYLRDVTITDKKLPVTVASGMVKVPYPDDYYHALGVYADATMIGCSGVRRFPIRRMSKDKIRRALKNSKLTRFWDFEEGVALQTNTGYNLYTEDGLSYEVYLDYIKKIPDVAAPQFEETEKYIGSDGKQQTQNKDLETDNVDLFHKIVSVAALLSKRDRGLAKDYELQLKTLTTLDFN